MPQQVGGFLEGGLVRQLVNVDAAIREHAGIAVDPADAGIRCHHTFKSLDHRRRCHVLPSPPPARRCAGDRDAAIAPCDARSPIPRGSRRVAQRQDPFYSLREDRLSFGADRRSCRLLCCEGDGDARLRLLRTRPATGANRPQRNGDRSISGRRLVIHWLRTRPVPGPSRIPFLKWPVATQQFSAGLVDDGQAIFGAGAESDPGFGNAGFAQRRPEVDGSGEQLLDAQRIDGAVKAGVFYRGADGVAVSASGNDVDVRRCAARIASARRQEARR